MATHDSLVNDHSLRVHPEGLALALQLPWYRSLWLSSVNEVRLSVDGEPVPAEAVTLRLGDRSFAPHELERAWDTLWFLQDRALLVVEREPIALGDEHEIDITVDMSIPYMQIRPGEDGGPGVYVPNRVRMVRRLTATETEGPTPPAPARTGPLADAPEPREEEPFRLGLTLYCATAELAAGWYDLDSLLARVDDAGVGPGIEIVASQTLPSYPHVTDGFVRTWRSAFDKYGFEASSFGANLDMGRRRDRDMTPDEEYEFTRVLFEAAKTLGFPLVRIQSAKRDLIRRLLPLAERLDLRMAYEIHAPLGPNSPEIMRVREVYDEFDSPLLGFVADFSSTMHAMSPTLLRAVRRMGLDEEAVDRMRRIWATDEPMRARQEEFIAYLRGRGIDPASLGPLAHLAFNMHGHVDPAEWADIMPQILHVHSKFYDIDESGLEPAIDYPELVRVFVEGGYRGFWSSEWEGHAFADLGDTDPIVLVQKQHALIRRTMHRVAARP
ncbi:C-glycoside deglycosidase beta subunit domain-containing protein [Nocardiopsis sp. LOL_012]|uniref:C-glycoside deglycosidase beta subunit domain-containing protein n=1 Tax=Nocardiopsis sp. LOL_012 TaxID=3345409 RepID=UPI003A841BB1